MAWILLMGEHGIIVLKAMTNTRRRGGRAGAKAPIDNANTATPGGEKEPAEGSRQRAAGPRKRRAIQTALHEARHIIGELATLYVEFRKCAVPQPQGELAQKMAQHAQELQARFAKAGMGPWDDFCSSLSKLLTAAANGLFTVTPSTLRTVGNSVDALRLAVSSGNRCRELRLEPIRLLLVDDDQVCLRSLGMALRGCNLDITGCENAEQALACLKESRFDAVFSDVMMPEMDGFEFAKELRQLEHHRTTPVVFVTFLSDFETRSRSITSGGCDLIAKPFMAGEVVVKAFSVTLKHRLESPDVPRLKSEPRAAEGMPCGTAPVARNAHLRAVLLLNRDGTIQSVNPDAASLLECPRQELMGKSIQAVFPDSMQTPENASVLREIALGQMTVKQTVDLVAAGQNGHPQTLVGSISPVQVRGHATLLALLRARPAEG